MEARVGGGYKERIISHRRKIRGDGSDAIQLYLIPDVELRAAEVRAAIADAKIIVKGSHITAWMGSRSRWGLTLAEVIEDEKSVLVRIDSIRKATNFIKNLIDITPQGSERISSRHAHSVDMG